LSVIEEATLSMDWQLLSEFCSIAKILAKKWRVIWTIFAKKKPTGVERLSHAHRTLQRERSSYENRYGSENERIFRCVLRRSQACGSTS
jgi:hypothetical protein